MAALQSSITAVTVFQSGASVTRSASAPSRAGTVRFEGLPLCLDDDSVRVALGSQAAARGWAVVDVRVEVDAPRREPTPEPEDDAEITAASQARDRAARRLEATQASIEALRGVELRPRLSESKDLRPDHDPTAGRLRWLELQAQGVGSLREAMVAEREALGEAEEALAGLLDAKRVRSSDRDPRAYEPRKRVSLQLVGEGEGDPVPIELSYRVPGARWAPSYVLRLQGASGAALQLRAVVAQNTGEDWDGARLTVSTASWQRWHDLPRLDALRVGRSQPPTPRAGWRAPPGDPEGLYADYDRFVGHAQPRAPAEALEGAAEAAPAPKLRAAKAKKAAPLAEMQSTGALPGAGGGPPPPPMPASAPPPPQAAPMVSRSRARPKEEAPAVMASALQDAYGLAEPPSEPSHGLGRAWFDYGRLRLPLPHQRSRGHLQRVEVLTDGDAHDITPLLRRARQRARALEGLPPEHAWVQARPGHAYAYASDAEVELPSDGQGHVVSVLEVEVETSRSHVCVPGITPEVFRTLAARNPLPMPLPAGPLDVYDGETYLLSASVETTAAAGRFEIGLGVEQAIKVARNVSFSEDSEGLIKRSNAYAHRIVIDVQNLLSAGAAVEIRERVPVAAAHEDDIEVTESSVEPPWDQYAPKDEPLEGGRRWRLELAAGEKATLSATYTVRVPGGSELVGGNRREA